MGNWFSNMSIRTGGPVTVDAVAKALCRIMDKRGYEPAAEADADGVAALVGGENAEWITVCTELLTLAEPEIFAEVGTVLSRELHTDVLGIACFDSDFLWLNLLNADENVDGWVGIGSGKELGFTRRNKLTPWKKKVRDYARFAQCAREEYVLADSFLRDTADCLGLPVSQSWASATHPEELGPTALRLYFRQREDLRVSQLPRMAHYDYGLPCLVGYESYHTGINMGAAGTGLKIWFLINGVERDEVTYENVYIRHNREKMPVTLTWAQMPDGRWAWCWHDPEFAIPPAVTGRMTKEKRQQLENQRIISIYFTPRGNSRKTLDIRVGFAPDENPDGSTWWYVWRKYGCREDFIKHHNRTWKWCWSMKDPEDDARGYLPLLKREDFD